MRFKIRKKGDEKQEEEDEIERSTKYDFIRYGAINWDVYWWVPIAAMYILCSIKG